MIAYEQGIEEWEAKIVRDGYGLQDGVPATRRSSLSSSTASDSSAASEHSASSKSSFTSVASPASRTTSWEQEDQSNQRVMNAYAIGESTQEKWCDLSQLIDKGYGSSESQCPANQPTELDHVTDSAFKALQHQVHWDSWQQVGHETERSRPAENVSREVHPSLIDPALQEVTIHPPPRPAPSAVFLNARHASRSQAKISQQDFEEQNLAAQDCALGDSISTNPRRKAICRTWSKPTLVRQDQRRQGFVLNLVDAATQLISFIWPQSNTSLSASSKSNAGQVISLGFFVQETLRRSRSTYSTLQLTLYYLCLLKNHGNLSTCGVTGTQDKPSRSLQCGRRMFLSGLILASKYLQDRNYSAKAWSKISSLPVQEINTNERIFLQAIDYNLHLKSEKYQKWCQRVNACVSAAEMGQSCPWARVITLYGKEDTMTAWEPIRPSESDTTVVSTMFDSSALLVENIFARPTRGACLASSYTPAVSVAACKGRPLQHPAVTLRSAPRASSITSAPHTATSWNAGGLGGLFVDGAAIVTSPMSMSGSDHLHSSEQVASSVMSWQRTTQMPTPAMSVRSLAGSIATEVETASTPGTSISQRSFRSTLANSSRAPTPCSLGSLFSLNSDDEISITHNHRKQLAPPTQRSSSRESPRQLGHQNEAPLPGISNFFFCADSPSMQSTSMQAPSQPQAGTKRRCQDEDVCCRPTKARLNIW